MKTNYTLQTIDKTAKKLLQHFNNNIILFEGEMGTGKTTLIKAIVKALGGNSNDVSSPTFSLVNQYNTPKQLVYHFDFYRIKNEEEALDIGFDEYCYTNHWVFIEWPKKIKNLLPFKANIVYLTRNNDFSRSLTLKIS